MRWAVPVSMLILILILLAAVATANPVYVPTYSARSSDDAILRDVLAELRTIRRLLERQQSSERPPESLKALLTNRCAECHRAAVAEKAGGGFMLLDVDGSAVPLSLAERRRISREVESGRMPKERPALSDIEREALKRFLFPEVKP